MPAITKLATEKGATRVSRIIAGSEEILLEHLAEATHFRSLDSEEWAG